MSFGHTPFGHEPFGHSSSEEIYDLAKNPLATGSTAQMLGWIEPSEALATQEELGLRMYYFILESIREEDKQNHFFLKNYLEGPDLIWNDIQTKIFAIKNLWDIENINDEHLPYLKRIVGWTSDTDSITESLDNSTLRRLIATSVALWKKRGPEDAITDVISLTTNARLRVYNWFDYRWILDETIVEETHQGLDSWMVGLPNGSTRDEYVSSLKIVDDGTLDKDLVVNLVKLMRATNERWEVHYINFLDLFTSDGDNYQWEDFSSTLDVSDGTAKLETSASRQIAVVDTTQTFTNYVAFGRLRGSSVTSDGYFGLVFYSDGTESNCYTASLNTDTNTVEVHKIVSGTKTQIASVSFLPWGYLVDDVWYGLRIQVMADTVGSSTMRIKVFVDAEEIINFTDTTYGSGTCGFWHEANATIEVDEIEMFTLPSDSDYVDINS